MLTDMSHESYDSMVLACLAFFSQDSQEQGVRFQFHTIPLQIQCFTARQLMQLNTSADDSGGVARNIVPHCCDGQLRSPT